MNIFKASMPYVVKSCILQFAGLARSTTKISVRKIKAIIWSAFAALSITQAHAIPIGMVFEGPSWNSNGDMAIFGTASTLNIQLDNGTDNISQSYDITSVLSASVTSSTGVTLLDWTSTSGRFGTSLGAQFITTSATGQGILTIGAARYSAYWEFFDNIGRVFQLGQGMYTSWDSRLPNPYAWYHGNINPISAQVAPVPVPGTIALFSLGLLGLGWNRRCL